VTRPPSDTEAATERLIEGDVIVADLPCVRCTYNLRGLSPDGRCPECGQEILLAIYGLERVGRLGGGLAWLQNIARGCKTAAVCQFLFIPMLLFLVCASLGSTISVVMCLLWLCGHVLSSWWITWPRESARATIGETAVRLAARWGGVGVMACAALLVFGGSFGVTGAHFTVLALGCYVGAQLSLLGYLHRLARSMPAVRLTRLSGHLIWLLPAAFGLPAVLFLSGFLGAASYPLLLGAGVLAALIGPMFAWQMYVALLLEFGSAFGTAARLAASRRAALPASGADGNPAGR
jgi:hypothetical protein